jgi:cell division protein FtsZ
MTRTRAKPEQPKWLDTGQEEAGERIGELGRCRIIVLGIGGAGNNTVDRLMEAGVSDVDCIAINTDLQHLNAVRATKKILIGEKVTKGLGAGGDPKVGKAAIEESIHKIDSLLNNVDVVFIAAGLGGGTGTAAAPVVAELARKKGAIVVGFVTAPFRIEKGRMRHAVSALNGMRRACDTVVVIDNNKLMELVPHHPIKEAFKVADQVLANMIQGIVETISEPSLVNLDFADFRTVVRRGGVAVVGVGESDAPNRAEEAVRNALKSPLLDVDYTGATGALIHVVGDNHMTIEEANRVGEIVTEMMGHDALVIWGARAKPSEDGFLKVTLMMTGVNSPKIQRGYGTMMPKLYDIESSFAEPETSLHLDLGLDQLENFAE